MMTDLSFSLSLSLDICLLLYVTKLAGWLKQYNLSPSLSVGLDDNLTILQQQCKVQRSLPSRTSGPEVSRHSGGQESYL